MPPAEVATTLPPCPRAVLGLGFVRRRTLADAAPNHLSAKLRLVLTALGERLASLPPGTRPPAAAPALGTWLREAELLRPRAAAPAPGDGAVRVP